MYWQMQKQVSCIKTRLTPLTRIAQNDKSCNVYYSNIIFLFYLSRWGTTVDFTTSFLHFSRFSAFCGMIFHSRPVHSLTLSFHRFLCLLLRLLPWTVPCRKVLASPDDRMTCPYHFSLRLFTEVRRSSCDPMALSVRASFIELNIFLLSVL